MGKSWIGVLIHLSLHNHVNSPWLHICSECLRNEMELKTLTIRELIFSLLTHSKCKLQNLYERNSNLSCHHQAICQCPSFSQTIFWCLIFKATSIPPTSNFAFWQNCIKIVSKHQLFSIVPYGFGMVHCKITCLLKMIQSHNKISA